MIGCGTLLYDCISERAIDYISEEKKRKFHNNFGSNKKKKIEKNKKEIIKCRSSERWKERNGIIRNEMQIIYPKKNKSVIKEILRNLEIT